MKTIYEKVATLQANKDRSHEGPEQRKKRLKLLKKMARHAKTSSRQS